MNLTYIDQEVYTCKTLSLVRHIGLRMKKTLVLFIVGVIVALNRDHRAGSPPLDLHLRF